ncbi:MAG TPA: SRPBCC family protein, partial [Mycobacterium sp.]|nr:SRPBCC family protein [Mycobacterium sp.]
SRAIPISPDEAFAKTMPMPLPELFARWYGPIPPIKAVRGQVGEWAGVGQTRTIALVGGGGMRETLTSVDAPRSFGYTLSDVRGAMAPLIDHVEGQWLFTPHGTGTLVTWRWTLHPRSALSAPALPVFARIWRGYARQALETLSGHLVG